MGLFSKKKKQDETDEIYSADIEDTEFDDVKGIGKGEPINMSFALTPEEIKGTSENRQEKPETGISPLEELRRKLLASTANTVEDSKEKPEEIFEKRIQKTANEEDDGEVTPFFTVNTDIDEEKEESELTLKEIKAENEDLPGEEEEIKYEEETAFDAASLFSESLNIPDIEEKSETYKEETVSGEKPVFEEEIIEPEDNKKEITEEIIEPTAYKEETADEIKEVSADFNDDVSKDIFDMFLGEQQKADAEVETYIPSSALKKEEEANEESLLENCKPFILDGSDETALEKKPEYTLDSVQKILGLDEESEEDIKNDELTKVFDAVKENIPDISDIDSVAKIPFSEPLPSEEISATAPVVIDDALLGNTSELNKSSEEISKFIVPPVLQDIQVPEQEYVPDDEYNGFEDAKRIRKKLLKSRRSFFIKSFISGICFITVLLLKIPFFSELLAANSIASSLINAVLLLIPGVFSFDMFKSISDLIKRRSNIQILLVLAYISSLICVLIPALFKFSDLTRISGITAACIFALLSRNLLLFAKYSYIYKNFRIISNKSEKSSLFLIDDSPTTVTMARRAIDGDVLVAAVRKTKNVSDFMKHSFEDTDYKGNSGILLLVAVLFSAISVVFAAIISGDTSIENITSVFAALNLFFALPLCIAANILPLKFASRHLNKYGAMIPGINSAEKIEQANAMAFECNKLFPSGSVTLSDMKVLSPNKLDETIAAACAITLKIKSPLYPIFKQILDTGHITDLPEQDSIKYDENLGLTGWVNDERIYIGNRSLMEVRGIKIPPVDVDKKILKNGYFPIYVSRGDSACALLSVQYTPDNLTAKEVRRVSDLGITLLINNCDQNITESMVKDYFDLYNDDSTAKVMNGSGVHMYKTAVAEAENLSAPAVCGETLNGLCAVVYAANKIKKSKRILDIMFTVFAVIGAMVFAYTSVYGNPLSYSYILIYQIVTYIIGTLSCIFNKP